MELTNDQLKRIMPTTTAARRAEALPIINACCRAYDINNERRMAAFLATLAAESGELKYQEEIASGAAYEGRSDLGNNQKGDGRKFKGHGRIQITGRDNHTKYTNYLKRSKHLPFVDFVANPKALAVEPYATDAAGWFWTVYKKLNPIADRGDFLTTQIRVNGRNKKTGLPNHYDVRQRYYTRALSVLPDNFKLDSAATPQTSNSAEPSDQTTASNNSVEPTEQPPINTGEQSGENIANVEGDATVLQKVDAVGNKWSAIQATMEKFGVAIPDAKTSIGTWIVFGFKSIIGVTMTALGVLYNHWEYFLIAALALTLAYFIYEHSRKRVTNEKAGIPADILRK